MSEAQWMWVAWGAMAGIVGGYGWMWKKAGERGRKWLEWGLAALVAGVSAASVATHEPWMDELHTWIQARELTLGEIWREMAYEGHFVPWHWILHPFARGGAPVEAMGWISWVLNAAAVAWFVRKAPLGGWAKAAAGLSCAFLYVNPVISRCYVLVPPILFGLACAGGGGLNKRPVLCGVLVALLANTHMCMEGTAAALSGVFAWKNVLRRKNGKGGRERGRQWAGLGVMAMGGALAVAQVLPSLWKSSVHLGDAIGWRTALGYFGLGCQGRMGAFAMLAGWALLGVVGWRRDKGVFLTCVASWVWMAGFSVFLYPANIINRALLWWPVGLWAAWTLAAGKGGGTEKRDAVLVGLAVVAMGLGLTRPDMTWRDWREEYDPIRGACRAIAARDGGDAEVWIEANDLFSEGALAYLDNVMDWRTGQRAKRIQLARGWSNMLVPFGAACENIFNAHPEKERILVMGNVQNGLTPQYAEGGGWNPVYVSPGALWLPFARIAVLEVPRGRSVKRGAAWMEEGMARMARGDRAGAVAAWERAVRWDGELWEAMNNLAWVLLEEGRVGEARAWIDRAMECEGARESAGARDTEAAVRRAEERRSEK